MIFTFAQNKLYAKSIRNEEKESPKKILNTIKNKNNNKQSNINATTK